MVGGMPVLWAEVVQAEDMESTQLERVTAVGAVPMEVLVIHPVNTQILMVDYWGVINLKVLQHELMVVHLAHCIQAEVEAELSIQLEPVEPVELAEVAEEWLMVEPVKMATPTLAVERVGKAAVQPRTLLADPESSYFIFIK